MALAMAVQHWRSYLLGTTFTGKSETLVTTKVLNGMRRGGEAKPQAMTFLRRDLWRQFSSLYKILYISTYALYCHSISY